MDAVRRGLLRDRPVVVLGLARSGIAVARFLTDCGARVTVYDVRPEAELGAAVAALDDRDVRRLLGPEVDPAGALRGTALIVTSPSINPDYPTTEPRLRAALQALVAARRAGDRAAPALVSEPDLFLRLCVAPTIGVTGTKGKTTTASLTAALLAADPAHPSLLGGNIGTPLVERLPELTPSHRVVYELSELQIPTLSRGTTVAAYTNVTADHLDRHGSLEAYRRVKRRLAELVDRDGALVLNLDDPVVGAYEAVGGGRVVGYRADVPAAGGVGVVDGWIVAEAVEPLRLAREDGATANPAGRIMPVAELAIPGRHNLSNALAAVGAALLFGVAPAAIRGAAAAFRGVPHRLETVAVLDGIRFVNDSMGTQPDAVVAALRSFEGPIVLIAGGRDKGVDMAELAVEVAARVAAAVLIGESAGTLGGLFRSAGLAWIEDVGELARAVPRAYEIARAIAESGGASADTSGRGQRATVLLSPAAASFDQFVDYAARGEVFRAAVAALAADEGGAAGQPRAPG
jgi:UDP-N-acetylmuramoylalanine--D-glutamate ligase